MYAPEIDTLWEADLSFVQDVAKENDGVSCLLILYIVYFQNMYGSDR